MGSDLSRAESRGPISQNVPLAPMTTLGIGGAARWFARAASADEVIARDAWAAARGAPMFVLGGGSNLVIADRGFEGLVLRMHMAGVQTAAPGDDTLLVSGAGESWDDLVAFAVSRNLAGIECLSGIPGTVGGTPVQNVGAYGQEVGSVIEWVHAVDRLQQKAVRLSQGECRFAYRTSRFKQEDDERFVICEVAFRLRPGGSPTVTYRDLVEHFGKPHGASPSLGAVRDAVLSIRRGKGMVIDAADPDTRSVGSFFMNPVVDRATFEEIGYRGPQGSAPQVPHFLMDNGSVKIPAAWLIEQSGFARGHTDGAVGLSTKHPLAIINRGGATARDVIRLACRIKRDVMTRFGVALRPEPVFVGFSHDPDVEYLRG
jgi:UDP-N-acetylmuramate dehydrogenase